MLNTTWLHHTCILQCYQWICQLLNSLSGETSEHSFFQTKMQIFIRKFLQQLHSLAWYRSLQLFENMHCTLLSTLASKRTKTISRKETHILISSPIFTQVLCDLKNGKAVWTDASSTARSRVYTSLPKDDQTSSHKLQKDLNFKANAL